MYPEDLLCRSVVSPVAFAPGTDTFDPLKCVDFTKSSNKVKPRGLPELEVDSYGLSFGGRDLLKTVEGAHRFGCSNSAASNAAITKRNNGVPPDEKKRRRYLGFYDIRHGAIAAIKANYYHVSFGWKPEEADEHFQLDLQDDISKLAEPPGTKADRRGARQRDRLAAMTAIFDAMFGLRRHVCDCDAHEAARLNAIELPAK
jgi:hypothetical protein